MRRVQIRIAGFAHRKRADSSSRDSNSPSSSAAAQEESCVGVDSGNLVASGWRLHHRGNYHVHKTDRGWPTPIRPTPIIASTRQPPTLVPTRTSTPAPVTVTFDTLGTYPVGRLVILSGILEMFKSTYCGTECGLLLSENSGSENKITIFVRVAAKGEEPSPNQMKALPNPFSKWDVIVCLNDGTLAYIGNRITVTGKICKTTAGDLCISNIIKIEKEQ